MKGKIEDYLFGKEQPSAVPLEEAVIGACLLDKDAYFIVRDILEPRKMYSDAHKVIMGAFDRLSGKSAPIDLLTVTEELKSMGKLEAVGGGYYLVELTSRVASSANIEHHSRIIQQKWIQRELIKLSYETIKNCYENEDVFDSLKRIDAGLMDVTDVKRAGEMTIFDAALEMQRLAMLRRDRGGDMVGTPVFGIQELDRLINGKEPGDVILISGRPGSGKSSLVTNVLDCCADTKQPAYFWSGEAPMHKMAGRLVSMRSRVPVRDLERGKFLENPQEVDSVVNQLRDIGITVFNGQMDIPSMKRVVTMEYRMKGVGLFIFDRVELFQEAVKARSITDIAKVVGDITGAMRGLANELGITMIPLSQLGKSAQGKRPEMSDVYGGTLIEGNCTKIIGVWQPGKHGEAMQSGVSADGMGEIVVMKNNYDSAEMVEAKFDGPCQCWRSQFGDIPVIKDDNPF